MTFKTFTESVVEDAALAWLDSIGFSIAHGPDIAPDTLSPVSADAVSVCTRKTIETGDVQAQSKGKAVLGATGQIFRIALMSATLRRII
jgi:hypothetical protein